MTAAFAAVTVALFLTVLIGFARYACHNSQTGDRDA